MYSLAEHSGVKLKENEMEYNKDPLVFFMPPESNGFVYVETNNGGSFATCYTDNAMENAERIVLCVNACAGKTNEELLALIGGA